MTEFPGKEEIEKYTLGRIKEEIKDRFASSSREELGRLFYILLKLYSKEFESQLISSSGEVTSRPLLLRKIEKVISDIERHKSIDDPTSVSLTICLIELLDLLASRKDTEEELFITSLRLALIRYNEIES